MKYFARVGKHEFKEIQVCSIKNDSASVSVVNACRAITSQDVQEVNAKDMTNSTIVRIKYIKFNYQRKISKLVSYLTFC